MKRLLPICVIAGFILATAGLVSADDVIVPEWAEGYGTVFAAWEDWTDFPGPMPPDWWGSNPPGLDTPYAYAEGLDTPYLLESFMGRDDVIELNGDYELIFDMPNFPIPNEYKEVWIQVTYYPTDPSQHPCFDVYTDGIFDMSEPELVGWSDRGGGWILEAWNFQILPNPEWEDIALNFTGDEPYPAYVDQVVIDTWCVPEPATVALLGLGALSLLRKKRSV